MKTIKNILLLYPRVPQNTYWSFQYALKFVGKQSSMPPLGLITVAALIPDAYTVRLIDQNIEPLKDGDLEWADMVFLSAMLVQKASFRQVVERCRRFNVPVVAGGPYPTSSHQEISGVRHFVLGEVEDTIESFFDDLERGQVKRVYYPVNRPRMDRSIIPRFDLLKRRAYASMSIQYSRGCPFRCEFCDIWQTFGNTPRTKSPSHVELELDTLYGLGWRGSVFVVDDNFIGNKRRLKQELLPMLTAWQRRHDFAFRFFTEASINMADDTELLNAMRDAGFNEVFIGIETPSANALKETGKSQNLKTDMAAAVTRIQRYGMEVMAGFILGFDSDTPDIFDRQLDFIHETAIPKAMVGLLNALPCTRLHDRLKKEGRLLYETDGNNTHHLTTNFKTRMPAQMLKSGYQHLLSRLYDMDLKNYFSRCNRMLDRLQYTGHFQRTVRLQEMMALIRSLLHQPFTPYGINYIKFLSRNLLKHARIFSEVVRLAIQGHHFHVITQQTLKVERMTRELNEGYHAIRTQIELCMKGLAGHSRVTVQRIADVWLQKRRFLADIRKKIDTLPFDFREGIHNRYLEVSHQLKTLFGPFADELSRNSIQP